MRGPARAMPGPALEGGREPKASDLLKPGDSQVVPLDLQQVGEFGDRSGGQVPVIRGCKIPFLMGTVLCRPGDERCGEPGFSCSRQVTVMRRCQHHFARIEAEYGGRLPVGIRVRLVLLADVRAEDHVPWKPRCLGHVQEERGVAVGQRADDEAPPDLADSFYAVGPRRQEAPGTGQRLQFFQREAIRSDAMRAQHRIQVFPVQRVEGYIGPLTRAHAFHGRLVLRSPRVREFLWVEGERVDAREGADS